MVLKLRLPHGPDALFSRTAADNMVGQTFEAKSAGINSVGLVLEAEVVEFGQAILLTVEWPNPVPNIPEDGHGVFGSTLPGYEQ